MAITVFLAGVTSSVQSFIADATVEVSQRFSNKVTNHPVDTRSNRSDHAFNENPEFTVKGVVSNHPVSIYDSNIIGYSSDRAIEADKLLRELWQTRGIFSLLTEYEDYNNCILTSYTATFTAASSEALEFEVTMQQIRTAHTDIVSTYLPENLAVDSKKSNNGSSQAESIATEEGSPLQLLLTINGASEDIATTTNPRE